MIDRARYRQFLIQGAHRVETLAQRALHKLDATPAQAAPVVVEPLHDDPNVAAVQKARAAAAAAGDTDQADRLAAVEVRLRRQLPADSVIPTHTGRLSTHDELEGIRKRLLANTPRPNPSDRD